ncbi:unnamed protein product [Pleuronectes platessa]|uniref:Uncharacterized protein n=1 Tax=Pleuronectes platessa TaxID=8262 RepID=A0A9N7V8I0_PLEPL|nr:unnamed protein product [Pleuronectes platessa]
MMDVKWFHGVGEDEHQRRRRAYRAEDSFQKALSVKAASPQDTVAAFDNETTTSDQPTEAKAVTSWNKAVFGGRGSASFLRPQHTTAQPRGPGNSLAPPVRINKATPLEHVDKERGGGDCGTRDNGDP